MILNPAVRDGKLMQDLELESLCNGVGHSQMVKDHPIANDSGSRDFVKLPSPTAVSRLNVSCLCIKKIWEDFKPDSVACKLLQACKLAIIHLGISLLKSSSDP